MSAFSAMMGGAECSTSSNPLSSLLKQQQQDHSLHHQGFAGPGAAGPSASSMRSHTHTPPAHLQGDADADRFFHPHPHAPAAPPLAMDAMRRELENVSRGATPGGALKGDRGAPSSAVPSRSRPTHADTSPHARRVGVPVPARGLVPVACRPGAHGGAVPHATTPGHAVRLWWSVSFVSSLDSTSLLGAGHSPRFPNRTAEFRQQQHFPTASSAGPAFAPGAPASSSAGAMYSRPGFAPSYGSYGGGMMGGMRSFGASPAMHAPAAAAQQPQQGDAKGKGRFVELDDADWEAQFARVGGGEGAAAEAESATKEAAAEVAAQEQKSDQANVLDQGEVPLDATESDAQLLRDLESTWAQLKGQLGTANAQDAELAQWEAQYGSQFNDLHGSPLLDADGDDDDLFGLSTPEIRRAPTWTRDNVDAFLQDQSAFPFADENTYLERPGGDPFAEGVRLLSEGAPLSEAALAFEAACRLDETRAEAWKAAGETWAADEREARGIRALEKAVACGGAAGVSAWLVRCSIPLFLFSI